MTVRHVLAIATVLVLGFAAYVYLELADRSATTRHRAAVASGTTRTPLSPRGLAQEQLPEGIPAPAPVAPAPEMPLDTPARDADMAEATSAFERGDFADAKRIAGRLLATSPTDTSMLRVMVSASCIEGDSAVASANYVKLPPVVQEQMKSQCARYGVSFPDRP